MDAPGKTFAKLLGILEGGREVVRRAEGEAFVGQAEGAVEGIAENADKVVAVPITQTEFAAPHAC